MTTSRSEAERGDRRRDLASAEAALAAAREELARRESELEEARAEGASAKRDSRARRKRIGRLRRELDDLTTSSERALAEARGRADEATRAAESAVEESAAARAELDRARCELGEKLDEANEAREEASRAAAANERELAKVRARLGGARRERSRLRGEVGEARADAAEARLGLQSVDPPIFFVVGHARSGTTWLMRTLDAHPEILCKGEGRFFGRSYKRPDLRRDGPPTIQPSSLYRAVLDADYVRYWIERSVWTRDDPSHEHLTKLTGAAVRYFLAERLRKAGKSIVGDKTPFLTADVLEELAEICPGAKVLHIIRDGRDVAVSGMHHLWTREIDLSGGRDLQPEEAEIRDRYRRDPRAFLESGESIFTAERLRAQSEQWRLTVTRAREDGPKLLGENYLELRYEELLEDTRGVIRRALQFLGADARPRTLAHCVTTASFKRWTKGRRRGIEDSEALLRKGVVGDWRRVMTDRDRSIFKEVAGDLLIELGYERASDW